MTAFAPRRQKPGRSPAGAISLLLTLVLILLVVAACGGGNNAEQPQDGSQPATDQPTLVCSQQCRDRGQCGDSTDRGTVVLLRRDGPAVDGHDLAVQENTTVQLLGVQPRNVVQTADGTPFEVNFFNVRVPDRGVDGWVPNWCLINIQS